MTKEGGPLNSSLTDTELPISHYECLVDPGGDRVANLPEADDAAARWFFVGRGIRKTGMDCLPDLRKERAGLVFAITNRDNDTDSRRKELIR